MAGAALLVSAAAAAGAGALRRRAPKAGMAAFDPAAMPGATDPLGFFDPAGFSRGKDEGNFRKLRIAETKHGRVAMMASIGTVISHFTQFPGFEGAPAGIGALSDPRAQPGLIALFLVSGVLELAIWKQSDNKEPGDFGDPLNWKSTLEDKLFTAGGQERSLELNNGRMAMMAVLGQIAAELVTGKDAVQQFGVA